MKELGFVAKPPKQNSRRRLCCDKAAPLIDDLTNQLTVIGLCSARLNGSERVNDERMREDNLRRIKRAVEQASDLAEQLKTMCENLSSTAQHTRSRVSNPQHGNLSLVVGRSKRSI